MSGPTRSSVSTVFCLCRSKQPLRVGEGGGGCLAEWLQREKGLCALNTFSDNLCVFRCLAVHQRNGPGIRGGPRHRNHGTAAHSRNCLSFYPRDSCLCSVRRRLLCSSWSFFPRGEEEQKAAPPLASDHWDLLKTRFSYHRSKLAIFCVTEKGAQTDKPKPSARAQTIGPQNPCTKELSILVGIAAKPPVVGSRTKAKCAEYICITSCAATEEKGSLPATVIMVITQKAAPCSSSRAVISTAARMLPRTRRAH